jgi:hypothetical protein
MTAGAREVVDRPPERGAFPGAVARIVSPRLSAQFRSAAVAESVSSTTLPRAVPVLGFPLLWHRLAPVPGILTIGLSGPPVNKLPVLVGGVHRVERPPAAAQPCR